MSDLTTLELLNRLEAGVTLDAEYKAGHGDLLGAVRLLAAMERRAIATERGLLAVGGILKKLAQDLAGLFNVLPRYGPDLQELEAALTELAKLRKG